MACHLLKGRVRADVYETWLLFSRHSSVVTVGGTTRRCCYRTLHNPKLIADGFGPLTCVFDLHATLPGHDVYHSSGKQVACRVSEGLKIAPAFFDTFSERFLFLFEAFGYG